MCQELFVKSLAVIFSANRRTEIGEHVGRGLPQYLGVPNLVILNLIICECYAEALFCALLRPFADLRLRSSADLHLRCFALFCANFRLSASERV